MRIYNTPVGPVAYTVSRLPKLVAPIIVFETGEFIPKFVIDIL